MKIGVLFLLFVIVTNITICQEITGYVFCKDKNTPLPFVNINIYGTTIGTVTNNDGFFSLNIDKVNINKKLVFSFIGYGMKTRSISDGTNHIVIRLEKSNVKIEEIVIKADSTIFTLLRRAYNNIPINYSKNPTLLTGFYRESIKQADDTYLYIAEAVINSYVTSYKNEQMGQVEIIKSRRNVNPNMHKKNNVKIYGGLFVAHNHDVVHEKSGAINPKNFKKYSYEYLGIYEYGNKTVYSFVYNMVDKNIGGNFYIDTKSLAYVYYDYNRVGEWQSGNIKIKRRGSHSKSQYSEINGVWFLKNCIYTSKLYNESKNMEFIYSEDYVTTEVDFNNIVAPKYSKQVNYTTIFSNEALNFKKSYWKGYNIIELDTLSDAMLKLQINTTDANNILTKEYIETKSGLDILLPFLLKTYGDFSLTYNNYSFNTDYVRIVYNGSEISNNSIDDNIQNISFSFCIGYKITNRLSIDYKQSENLNKNISYIQNQFNLSYLVVLKKGGKQFFAQPTVSYFDTYGGYYIGYLEIPNPTTINGTTFKKDGAMIYSGKKYQGISTGIIFKTNITKMLHFVVGANYYYPITTTDMFLLKEDGGLLLKKTYHTFNDDIEYYEDGIRKNSSSFELNNWSINTGIRFEF